LKEILTKKIVENIEKSISELFPNASVKLIGEVIRDIRRLD